MVSDRCCTSQIARSALTSPKVITFQPVPPLTTVLSVRRRMRAAGSSYLARASDGANYVLKLPQMGNPANLFREAFGTLLGAELGLPMAGWSALSFDHSFEDHTGTIPLTLLESGSPLCFGSRIPSHQRNLREYLPQSWIVGTDLARQMVRMQIFDAWVANGAPRQYMILSTKGSGELKVEFILNGTILKSGPLQPNNPYLTAIRLGVAPQYVTEMIDAVSGVLRITLERLANIIPECWITKSELASALSILSTGQRNLLKQRCGWLREANLACPVRIPRASTVDISQPIATA